MVVVERTTVGDIHAADAHAAARGRDDAGVGIGLDAAGEVGHDVVEADLRQDRNSVPLALAVVRAVVAESAECKRRKCVVGELGLLQEEYVGLDLGDPLFDAFLAGAQ